MGFRRFVHQGFGMTLDYIIVIHDWARLQSWEKNTRRIGQQATMILNEMVKPKPTNTSLSIS